MSDSYEIVRLVKASPKRLFEAWLDSAEHSSITGRAATISAEEGGVFSAVDGLVTGENIEIEPYHRIVQVWRTGGPGPDASESLVEVVLATGAQYGGIGRPQDDGTTVKVRHSGLSPGQTLFTDRWWEDNYFGPMDAYFAQGHNRLMRPS